MSREMVYDSWWPYRIGTVLERRKSGRVIVRWDDGEIWIYDKAHAKFLRVMR